MEHKILKLPHPQLKKMGILFLYFYLFYISFAYSAHSLIFTIVVSVVTFQPVCSPTFLKYKGLQKCPQPNPLPKITNLFFAY